MILIFSFIYLKGGEKILKIRKNNNLALKITIVLTIILGFTIIFSSGLSAADVIIDNSTSEGIKGSLGNDTISLNNGTYTGVNNTNVNVPSGKNLTIQSQNPNNKAIIDCQGTWFLSNGGNLTLINLIIKNANGGAIGSNGYLTIINCTFINNTGGDGGAIRNNANSSIIGSTFINNTATGSGGAIYSYTGNLNVSDSNFINNIALSTGWGGGAIYTTSDTVIINNSNFTNNTSGFFGGAIMAQNGANFTILNSNFTDNHASYGGAVMNSAIANFNIFNSLFNSNNATKYGGAIYTHPNSGYTNIRNSTFNDNYASEYGGAIFSGKAMNLSGNLMSGNIAGIMGNAILNYGAMGVLNLTYLNNSTVKVDTGTNVVIFATLTDDMGNPVSYGNISFYVNGVLIGIVEVVEGYANITYYFNETEGIFPVTGQYSGNEMNVSTVNGTVLVHYDINILNGQLIVGDTNVTGDIKLDKKEYWVNETVKTTVNVKNNGPNIAKNVSVKINIPTGFVLNPDSIIVSKGSYDPNTGIWYIGDLNPDEEAVMTFNGKFTKKGDLSISMLVYGDNFNNSTSVANALVKQNSTPTPRPTPGPTPGPTPEPNYNKQNVSANMKETGIPIIAVILILLASLGLLSYKKSK